MSDVAEVEALHREADREADRLRVPHEGRLRCGRGCAFCCVDDLTVFEVEARVIREHHADLLARGTPHPEGACAFLDAEGACRVYERRPYVCRSQGYPLRWHDEAQDGSPVEYRDICPLNDEPGAGPPIETLDADACWTIGPFEGRLAHLQVLAGAEPNPESLGSRRVRLRDLFARPSA